MEASLDNQSEFNRVLPTNFCDFSISGPNDGRIVIVLTNNDAVAEFVYF